MSFISFLFFLLNTVSRSVLEHIATFPLSRYYNNLGNEEEVTILSCKLSKQEKISNCKIKKLATRFRHNIQWTTSYLKLMEYTSIQYILYCEWFVALNYQKNYMVYIKQNIRWKYRKNWVYRKINVLKHQY